MRALTGRSCGPLRPCGCKFRIQNSRFKIKRAFWARLGIYFRSGRSLQSARKFGYELRASARRRLRPAAASYRSRKFKIQNSRFKIKRAFWARLGIYFRSGRSLQSARKFGYELRASARRRLRPAAASYRSRKFKIQNSRFKIKRAFWARLGIYFRSGRSLQSARKFGYELRASAAGRLRSARS